MFLPIGNGWRRKCGNPSVAKLWAALGKACVCKVCKSIEKKIKDDFAIENPHFQKVQSQRKADDVGEQYELLIDRKRLVIEVFESKKEIIFLSISQQAD